MNTGKLQLKRGSYVRWRRRTKMHPEAPYCRTTTATHSAAVDDDCAPTFSVAAVAAHTVVRRRQHMSPSRRRRRQPATVHISGAAVSTSQDLQLNAFPCCDPRLFCSSTPTGHFAGLRPCRQWGCSFLYPLSFVCDRRVIKRINILCK